MNYSDKIQASIRRIQEASKMLDRCGGRFTVCFSGGKRVGCMVCPFVPTKQLISVFNEFPNLKKKMLKTIQTLRETSNYASSYQDKTDEELLEWWMSKKNIREYFQPQFEF